MKSSKPDLDETKEAKKRLLGQTVLMRYPKRAVPDSSVVAIITGVDDAHEIELGEADLIVSVTAFPVGRPPESHRRIPLFMKEPSKDINPAAWPNR